MLRFPLLAGLLVLVAALVVPSAAAQSLSDCTGDPIGEGIYVSGCRSYALSWVSFAVGTALCFYNTAPAVWTTCIPPLL